MAGFLASALAYGRVQQIEKSVTKLLEIMGQSPYEFTADFKNPDRKYFSDFKHRFNSGSDIADLLELLNSVINEYGSIEKCFLTGYDKNDVNINSALSNFCQRLLKNYKKIKRKEASKGLKYFLCDPSNGSTCKRLNMFLRWMVRDDDVDTGIWRTVDKSKLIVPMDTHMTRLCKILGLYDKKTVNLKTAVEVTKQFAIICPSDPVKYDFSLSRIGIVEDCSGVLRDQCQQCELFGPFCKPIGK
jgi:uncharacterized protein (TIGR02757 family)